MVPQLMDAPPLGLFYLNSMVIQGREPVIVDTGTMINREKWIEEVFSLVDPNRFRRRPGLAAADFPEPDHPAHRVARAHKSAVLARLENLAEQAGAAHAAALAAQLFLLMDGAFVATRMFGQESPAAHVGAAAGTLIESAIPPDSP